MLLDACNLSLPVRYCWYFAGNIAALTVRFHQGMVSGKSVSHRQASFSMFFACCVAVQQDARGLFYPFLPLTGFPADFRLVFDSDLAEEAGTDSERVQAMRKGAVFVLLFFFFVFPPLLLVRHRLRNHEGLARFR